MWAHPLVSTLISVTAARNLRQIPQTYVNSVANSNGKEALSTESECTAPRIGDNDSVSVQLEAVCVNSVCTMEMV
jgi:hypothetical protein